MFANMGGGGYGVYIFFAAFTTLSIPFIFFLLPETKNVPLEEMVRPFPLPPFSRSVPGPPSPLLAQLGHATDPWQHAATAQDRLFLDPRPWSANGRVLAELQRERADRADPARAGKEELLFDPQGQAQQKTKGREDFVEQV